MFVCYLSVRDTKRVMRKRRRDQGCVLWNVEGGKGGSDILGSEMVKGVYLQHFSAQTVPHKPVFLC